MRNEILSILIVLAACTNQHGQNKHTNNMSKTIEHKHTNKLINETSPYLLQHAHNPVNWYAWGDQAFEKAKKENKLVLISIGYAACHWCHVMEHESFENEEIALLMNEYFVCIKVDREERPDIDQVYMTAVQMLTGSGGWPLNCFALPDGRPVYGGTYFQPEQWAQILEGLNDTYKKDPQRILVAAKEISEGIKNAELISVKNTQLDFSKSQAKIMYTNWKPAFDKEWGGNKRAPKFPLPISKEFLLQYAYFNENEEAEDHLNLSLTKIAQGGIYDHVGGGFARYSVDEKWKVPHFEKMMYDNGQLISLYSKAYKRSKNPYYKNLIEQSIDFINREMTTHEGAFYSSFDADSEGVEGKFYVWNKSEIENIVGNDSHWFCEYFNIKEHGNWEESNILWMTDPEKVIKKYKLDTTKLQQIINKHLAKILKERNNRIFPGLDDKILTAWNALMSIGYIDAYEAFGNKDYIEAAIKNATFIKEKMIQKDGNLHRNYKNNKSTINAFLDDYALSIQLFAKLYKNTFNDEWLRLANELTSYSIEHFYDKKSSMFFYTSDIDPELVVRKMELTDNVIPASNSIMANNLYDLGILNSNTKWQNIAQQMLANVIQNAEQNAPYYANWGILLNRFIHPQYEVVFVGKDALNFRKEFAKNYIPNVIIAGSDSENKSDLPLLENRWNDGETLIYVCQNKACKLPVKTIKEALELINL